MRRLGLVAIYVVVFWTGLCLRAGLAQQPDDRPTAHGMFGDRTLGRPVQPGASRFGNAIQRGPSGDFLGVGRTDGGSPLFATPWRRTELVPLLVVWGNAPPYVSNVLAPQPVVVPQEQQPVAAPQEQPWQVPGEQPQAPQQSTPGEPIWFRAPSPPSESATPVPPGSAGLYRPAGLYGPRSLGLSIAGAPGDDSAGAKAAFQPSPGISARITRLAQAGGLPSSSSIQVRVQGDMAIVRGTAATPYQRSLVENLVGLEPGVWHVDNQVIVVAGPGLATAEASH